MSNRPKRKPIPLKVKLEACLMILRDHGILPKDVMFVEWDHFPALELRRVNEAGDDWSPSQHDPRFIQPLASSAHALKTDGDHVHDRSKRQEQDRQGPSHPWQGWPGPITRRPGGP